MATDLKKSTSNGRENCLTSEEQQKKIDEVRSLIRPIPDRLSTYCSDQTISRYLIARNWNIKKATKMLKDSLKWRLEYKPDEIRWDDIAHEAETGKIYKSNYKDKHGRTVLVMRPRCQNTKSTKGQIKYLVYCMENAIFSLPVEQGQVVWLIDFHGFNMSHISFKVTRETAIVLQERYPERLGIAILYNAPKFFEPFWKLAKPFLEPKTANKVKFFYPEDPNSIKAMEDLFDMELVESAFGGKGDADFDINKYAERMKEDDKKISASLTNVSSLNPVIPESYLVSSEDKAVDESSSGNVDTDDTDEAGEKLPKVVDESSSGNVDTDDTDEAGEKLPVHTVDMQELSPSKLPGITISS